MQMESAARDAARSSARRTKSDTHHAPPASRALLQLEMSMDTARDTALKRTASPIGNNSVSIVATSACGTTLNKRQRNEKVHLIDEDVSANSICGSHAEEDTTNPTRALTESQLNDAFGKEPATEGTDREGNLETETMEIGTENESFSEAQISQLWFALLSQLADQSPMPLEPMPYEHFNWILKLAIGVLHVSEEPLSEELHLKSIAIVALKEILEEQDFLVKQERLAQFVSAFRPIVMNAEGPAISDRHSHHTNNGTSTDTELNSSEATHVSEAILMQCTNPLPDIQKTDTTQNTITHPARDVPNTGNRPQERDVSLMPLLSIPHNPDRMNSLDHSHSGDPGSSSTTFCIDKLPSVSWNPQLHFDSAHLMSIAGVITAPMNMSSLPMNDFEMRCSDFPSGSVLGNIMHLNLASNIPQTMTGPLDEHSTGFLPIPSNASDFPNKLAPPRLSDSFAAFSAAKGTAAAVVQNGMSTEMQSLHGTLTADQSVSLANAVLLISGDQQFLVIPSHDQNNGAVKLTERDIEESIKNGAAIPLNVGNTQAQGNGQMPSLQTDMQHIPQETLCLMPKMPSPLSRRGAKKENERLIKCLMTSGGQPPRPLFHIAGYVDNDLWIRLPATIAVTHFGDKTSFLHQSKQIVKLALSLEEDAVASVAVSRLFENNLVAVASLPGFNLIVVPHRTELQSHDIEVYVAPSTVTVHPCIE